MADIGTIVADSRLLLKSLLEQALSLRVLLKEDAALQRFVSDDLRMEQYNDIAGTLNGVFERDPELGSWVNMPDANIQMRGVGMGPAVVTDRTLARLERIIASLQVVLGVSPLSEEPPPADRTAMTPAEQEDFEAVGSLRAPGQSRSAVEARDFHFVSSAPLRQVLELDFIDAQRSFAAGAFKGSALLSGSVIEGVLMDRLIAEHSKGNARWDAATKSFPRSPGDRGGNVLWDRVSLGLLLEAAHALGLVSDTHKAFISGARDVRDTVHPNREVLNGWRADQDLAQMLLSLARALHSLYSSASQ